MGKITSLILFVFLLISLQSIAESPENSDTVVYKNMLLNEVVVISNPKSNIKAFETPASVSFFNSERLERQNILSIKDVSSIAPNFFIPDYGSKLTTAIYIRGIGTRTNNSVVGMYVDNIPYLDKSIFDFDFLDIERLEILRGPQSTLYGRNTMAGLINVYTKSPFDHQYTKAMISYGNYNSMRFYLSRYGKINDKLAYSLSGQYQKSDGYFKNKYNGEKADSTESANGRFQLYWKPLNNTNVNLTSNLEYSRQGGYPYGLIDDNGNIGDVFYNDPGSYNRLISSSSLLVDTKLKHFSITNTTGFQYFDDDMKLDQDFTEKSVFTLNQKQSQRSVSHEIVFKSTDDNNFKWLAGAFGFYQSLNTNAPVDFKKEGIDNMINAEIAQNIPPIPAGPSTSIILYDSLVNNNMVIAGKFKTPTWGSAVYTQFTYDNLFVDGLSLSAGVRLDYEKAKIDYDSYTVAYANSGVIMKKPTMAVPMASFKDTINIGIAGNNVMDNLELLPRFDLKYTPNNKCMAYASVSKGYRAGGFNFQMFSDAIRDQLKSRMIGEFIKNADDFGMGSRIPDNIRDMAEVSDIDVNSQIKYKPEYSWNYEIGTKAEVFENKLNVDFSVFYIDVRNQQISAFSEQGLGRITKNSGKSSSYGVEGSLRYYPISNLAFSATYGYTHATFKENYIEKMVDGETQRIDYEGNFIPFAPKHTMAVTANYVLSFKNKWIDMMNFNAQYAGAGRTYWTEDNSQYQNFYGTLSAKVSATKGIFEFSLWGKNLTDAKYTSFYFESLGKKLAQKGAPLTFGAELTVKF
ncbi:MAG: TonB-dependent receptor [Bacteroidales bacterium]|nr:TonB-dependent receptor [Bacteroidales bacterium]